jgi:hypothetical protein
MPNIVLGGQLMLPIGPAPRARIREIPGLTSLREMSLIAQDGWQSPR